jgi:hypothetical protein
MSEEQDGITIMELRKALQAVTQERDQTLQLLSEEQRLRESITRRGPEREPSQYKQSELAQLQARNDELKEALQQLARMLFPTAYLIETYGKYYPERSMRETAKAIIGKVLTQAEINAALDGSRWNKALAHKPSQER